MREIIFRGRRIGDDKSKWFYGDLHHTEKDFKKVVEIIDWSTKPYIHRIDSSTIGQYTGLKDKNDTRVFEGDICVHSDKGNYPRPLVVEWIDEFACFAFVDKGDFNKKYYFVKEDMKDLEVVGNIHDNRNLLK